MAQLLVQRTSLGPSLTGDDIKQAFQGSGLFLEASLAAGSAPASATPDLKAALVVLRQVLTTALSGTTETPVLPSATATIAPQAATTEAAVSGEPRGVPAVAVETSPQAPVITAEPEVIATAASIATAAPVPGTVCQCLPTRIVVSDDRILACAAARAGNRRGRSCGAKRTSSLSQVVLDLTAPTAATPAAAAPG